MSGSSAFVIISSLVLGIIGVVWYGSGILNGTVKPNKVTWLFFGITPCIAGLAMLSHGFTLNVVPVLMSGIGPLILLALTFFVKDSYWKLTTFDYLCAILSACAIVFWLVSENPFYAVLFAIIADATAAIPTFVKGWRFPETEAGAPFVAGFLTGVLGVYSAETNSFIDTGYSVYLSVSCLMFMGIPSRHIIAEWFMSLKKPNFSA